MESDSAKLARLRQTMNGLMEAEISKGEGCPAMAESEKVEFERLFGMEPEEMRVERGWSVEEFARSEEYAAVVRAMNERCAERRKWYEARPAILALRREIGKLAKQPDARMGGVGNEKLQQYLDARERIAVLRAQTDDIVRQETAEGGGPPKAPGSLRGEFIMRFGKEPETFRRERGFDAVAFFACAEMRELQASLTATRRARSEWFRQRPQLAALRKEILSIISAPGNECLLQIVEKANVEESDLGSDELRDFTVKQTRIEMMGSVIGVRLAEESAKGSPLPPSAPSFHEEFVRAFGKTPEEMRIERSWGEAELTKSDEYRAVSDEIKEASRMRTKWFEDRPAIKRMREELRSELHKSDNAQIRNVIALATDRLAKESEEACVMCCTNVACVRARPCGHTIGCQACTKKLKQNMCPMCRCKIEKALFFKA